MPIAEQGPGEFIGEIAQLGGAGSFADAEALEDVETLLIPTDRLRALIIGEADLGERIMRALILRRVMLIESESSGPVLIGRPSSWWIAVTSEGRQAPAPGSKTTSASRLESPGRQWPDVAEGTHDRHRHRCEGIPSSARCEAIAAAGLWASAGATVVTTVNPIAISATSFSSSVRNRNPAGWKDAEWRQTPMASS